MGITTDKQLHGIAEEFVELRRRERAFEAALFGMCREEASACKVTPCRSAQSHPAPWHAEYCGCAEEARRRFNAALAAVK